MPCPSICSAKSSCAWKDSAEAGRPIVIKGRKGIFSAGFDLKTFARGAGSRPANGRGRRSRDRAHVGPSTTDRDGLHRRCLPNGAFLTLCADVRFGVPGDWNIGMNEVAIGLPVPEFAVELARHR